MNSRLERANAEFESAYKELQRTQSQLVQAAKMASLGQLVAGVAHEINNPLAFSLSHLSTVRRSFDEVDAECQGLLSPSARDHWPRAQQRLQEMNLGLERIGDLVVKLRTFSRLDEGEFKQVSVKESLGALLTIVGHRLTDSIEVRTTFGEPDIIACFPSLLNQAVMNLVVNAIDAVEDSGTIEITTGAVGEHYVITVSDTGKGISDDLRERVFEPFFTTKAVRKGTGLGLSLAYSIVEKHAGTLSLESSETGTRATNSIPM